MRRAAHFVTHTLLWSSLSACALAGVPPQRTGTPELLTLPQGSSTPVRSVSQSFVPQGFDAVADPHPYVTEFYGRSLLVPHEAAPRPKKLARLLHRAERIILLRL